ncbi:MAG TPA: isopeptide-forming domain-containing fimbrial protein, partial [Herpetosiphonaceae bacterium]
MHTFFRRTISACIALAVLAAILGASTARTAGAREPDGPSRRNMVDPVLVIDKTVQSATAGVDAADTVQYRITINHAGGSTADAHNLNVTDDMPAALQGTVIASAQIGAVNVAASFAINGSGDLVTVGDVDLPLGQVLVINLTGTVRNTVNTGGTIANAATVTWQNSANQQLPGYTATDLAPSITIPLVFSVVKSTNPPVTEVVVGATVTYQLATTVIEGTTNNLQWVDTLPAGMSYVPSSLVVSNANGMTVNGLNVNLSGQTLTAQATSVINPGNVNNAAAADTDTFFLTYQATVNPVPAGTVLTNDVDASANPGLSDNNNSASVTVVEPALLVNKTITTATGGVDAGDTLRYQIRLTHVAANQAGAHNLNISDDMPAALQNGTIVSAIVSDGVNSRNVAGALSINGSGDLVTTGDIDLAINTNGAADESLTMVVQGTVRDAISPGGTIANAATVTWQNSANQQLPSYTATGLAPLITIPAPFAVAASITPPTSVVGVGDTITYQLATTVLEGTTNNLQWADTLPAGVTYVPGSLSVADANGMTVNGLNADLTGQILTLQATSVVNPGNVNNASAVDSDTFLLTYQVTVNPGPSGTVLTNDVDASADPGLSDNNNSVSVTVIAPELTLDATLLSSGSGVDAADIVSYQIVIAPTGTSGADANNLLITDTLPIQLRDVSLVSAIVSDGATSTNVAGAFAVSAGALRTVGDVDLQLNTNGAQDQRLTIIVTGTVADTVTQGATIANSATVSWANGAGQRRPSFSATDAAPAITVPTVFALAKALSPPASAVNVGQELTYHLTTTLLEGTTTNVEWVDTLPAGVTYVPGSATVSAANGMTVNGLGADLTGQILTIQAASIVNPGNVAASTIDSDSLVIAYRVTVNAVPNGAVLTNQADGAADPGLSDTGNTTTVTVREPELTLATTLLTSGAGVDAADAVRYRIQISHTAASASNALDLDVVDDLPGALRNVSLVSAIVSDGATSTNVAGVFAINGDGDLVTTGDVDLRLNTNGSNDQALTIVVAGTVRDTIAPGATIANSAAVTWENVAGLRNPSYAASGAAPPITVPAPFGVVAAVADGRSQATNGETLTYELRTTLLEGTTANLRWVDTLPAGLRYVPGSATVSAANGMTVNGFGAAAVGQVLTIQAGSVVNPGTVDDPASADFDTFTISYDVVVTAGAAPGAVLTNRVDASADNVLPDNGNAASVTVIAPALTISKTADTAMPVFGQVLTYTVTVSHAAASTADAHDLLITDTLPLGLSYVPGSASLPPGGVDESGDPVIVFSIPALSRSGGASQSFTYRAVVGAPPLVGIGDSLTNAIALAWTTRPGPAPDERISTAATAATVTASGVDLALSLRAAPATATPGAALAYTLVFTNQGNLPALSSVLTHPILPQIVGVSFVSSGAVVTNTGAVPAYVWRIGALAPGRTGIITVTGTLDPLLNSDQSLSSTATIAGGGDRIAANNSAAATISAVVPRVSLANPQFSAGESAGSASVQVNLSVANPAGDVVVDYATANGSAIAGSDYAAISGTLTIPRGQTSGLLTISIINDGLYEPTESFTITLSNARGAALAAPVAAPFSII